MKRVEFWFWAVERRGARKPVRMPCRMTVEVAMQRHPGAVQVPGSCEVRELPDSDEELWRLNQRPAHRR